MHSSVETGTAPLRCVTNSKTTSHLGLSNIGVPPKLAVSLLIMATIGWSVASMDKAIYSLEEVAPSAWCSWCSWCSWSNPGGVSHYRNRTNRVCDGLCTEWLRHGCLRIADNPFSLTSKKLKIDNSLVEPKFLGRFRKDLSTINNKKDNTQISTQPTTTTTTTTIIINSQQSPCHGRVGELESGVETVDMLPVAS